MRMLVKNLASRFVLGMVSLSLPLTTSILLGAWGSFTPPVWAEPAFTYVNTTATYRVESLSAPVQEQLATLVVDRSGLWTLQWADGRETRFRFTQAQTAIVESDRFEPQGEVPNPVESIEASYDQEFVPATGEFRYIVKHDRGEFSFLVLATDGDAYIDRQVMLAEQDSNPNIYTVLKSAVTD